MRRRVFLAAAGATVGTAGCVGSSSPGRPFRVSVPGSDGSLPTRYTCDGAGESPPITVESVPEPVTALAVTVESNRDAIIEPVHWALWNVPADRAEIPAGLPRTTTVETLGDARQGQSSGPPGYDPPCPAPGATEEYRMQVYGLDAPLELSGGAPNDDALDAITAGAVVSQRFVRTHERPADADSE